MRHMYGRPAVLLLTLLLACASIDDALAGHRNNGQSTSAQLRWGHVTASRHHARGADRDNGTYRSELSRNKSEWRQAQHRGNNPAPARLATHRDG